MNLTSCDNCGVVYDKDNMLWPQRDECFSEEDGSYSNKTTFYNKSDGEFYKKVPCRVCGTDIVDYSEQLWG